ncbi:MAG: hypothetical protein LBV13_05740 [Methanomassiliicoccaceae archaeon]|nr:hypothetical protein [Methanomassiliicoccaceae archaeon]
MLLLFGVAWPFSIRKAYKTKSNGGMSLFFIVIVLFGYFAGMINNIINGMNYVMLFYVANSLMIVINIYLFIRNMKYEKDNHVARAP